ncbi:MAG TPA: tryptophan synthase subunit alpha [Atribacteraceae bacterium]|nr:tryptophan synthase subunit alpha [Atribacteraceae bacterium]
MNRDWNSLALTGKKLFFPYLTYGFPDEATFFRCLNICIEQGVDAVEVGIPYSDPVADGPVIQASSQAALEQGVTPQRVTETFSRQRFAVPLIAMTYGNIVYRYGARRFIDEFSGAGFSGLIVADFPLEARSYLPETGGNFFIPLLVATTTGEQRLALIARKSEGFIYCVSGKGTTGNTKPEFTKAHGLVYRIRRLTATPVLLGFGIDSPDRAGEAARIADGAIVGSALIAFIGEHHRDSAFDSDFSALIRAYRQAIDAA